MICSSEKFQSFGLRSPVFGFWPWVFGRFFWQPKTQDQRSFFALAAYINPPRLLQHAQRFQPDVADPWVDQLGAMLVRTNRRVQPRRFAVALGRWRSRERVFRFAVAF